MKHRTSETSRFCRLIIVCKVHSSRQLAHTSYFFLLVVVVAFCGTDLRAIGVNWIMSATATDGRCCCWIVRWIKNVEWNKNPRRIFIHEKYHRSRTARQSQHFDHFHSFALLVRSLVFFLYDLLGSSTAAHRQHFEFDIFFVVSLGCSFKISFVTFSNTFTSTNFHLICDLMAIADMSVWASARAQALRPRIDNRKQKEHQMWSSSIKSMKKGK